MPSTSNKYLGNFGAAATTLYVPGATPVGSVLHVSLTVDVLNTWSGNTPTHGDRWRVTSGGTAGGSATVFDTTFLQNAAGTNYQSYPQPYGSGSNAAHFDSASNGVNLDGTGGANDSTYNLSFDVTATSACTALTFDSPYLTSGALWGLDNVVITADALPSYVPAGSPALGGTAAGLNGGSAASADRLPGGVRAADGSMTVDSPSVSSSGFGQSWAHAPQWTNNAGYSAGGESNGNGWVVSGLPSLVASGTPGASGSSIAVRDGGTDARWFDYNGSSYAQRFFGQDVLAHGSGEYTLTDTTGAVSTFYDFAVSPTAKQGKLKGFTDKGRNATTFTYNTDGTIDTVSRTDGTTTETFVYSYASGRISKVEQRRNGVTFRQIAYTYYGSGANHGNIGDLKYAVLEDGAGGEISTSYYRYYTSTGSTGYQGGLQYAFNGDAFARLRGTLTLGTDPDTVADGSLPDVADGYFEYDGLQRVTKQVLSGEGCACSGESGQGEYDITYTTFTNVTSVSSCAAVAASSYRTLATVTLPDMNQTSVYSNSFGETVARDFTVGTDRWRTYRQFDGQGRKTAEAQPSAVTGLEASDPTLVGYACGSGGYNHVSATTGQLSGTLYAQATTATTSTPGDVAGYAQYTFVQQGSDGTHKALTSITHSTTTATATTGSAHLYSVGDVVVVSGALTGAVQRHLPRHVRPDRHDVHLYDGVGPGRQCQRLQPGRRQAGPPEPPAIPRPHGRLDDGLLRGIRHRLPQHQPERRGEDELRLHVVPGHVPSVVRRHDPADRRHRRERAEHCRRDPDGDGPLRADGRHGRRGRVRERSPVRQRHRCADPVRHRLRHPLRRKRAGRRAGRLLADG